MFVPPPTNWSMSSVLQFYWCADRSELAEDLPGADHDLHMQIVELMQISGC